MVVLAFSDHLTNMWTCTTISTIGNAFHYKKFEKNLSKAYVKFLVTKRVSHGRSVDVFTAWGYEYQQCCRKTPLTCCIRSLVLYASLLRDVSQPFSQSGASENCKMYLTIFMLLQHSSFLENHCEGYYQYDSLLLKCFTQLRSRHVRLLLQTSVVSSSWRCDNTTITNNVC